MTDKWDKRFMDLAIEISKWSKDPSTKVGAIIVDNHRRIISTGYNGFPSGIDDTDERYYNRELKYGLVIHAELNALLNALRNGVAVKDGILYVYPLPVCQECAKAIIQSGIKEVRLFDGPELGNERWLNSWKKSSAMFIEAGVSFKAI